MLEYNRPGVAFKVVFAMLLMVPTTCVAQSCIQLPVDQSPVSYKYRANPPRCEGFYRRPVAGDPAMSLVSLTFGRVSYDVKHDHILAIKLLVVPTEKTLIQAVGIPERLYYRLDADLEPGQSELRLPLADVIARKTIVTEDFGIYGRRSEADGETVFIPVQATRPGGPAQAEIIAIVSPGGDVSDVQWRRYTPGTSITATEYVPVKDGSGFVAEGARLEIPLGKNIPPRTVLEVSYLSQGVGRADRFVLVNR